MNENDKTNFKKYDPVVIKANNKIYFDFKNENSINGLGWTHSLGTPKNGLWTEGKTSNILFRLEEKNKANNLQIAIKLNSIITKNNEPIKFTININDNLYKKFILKSLSDLKEDTIYLDFNKNIADNNIIHIKFLIDNPITKLELLESPDARKLGILVESIKLTKN